VSDQPLTFREKAEAWQRAAPARAEARASRTPGRRVWDGLIGIAALAVVAVLALLLAALAIILLVELAGEWKIIGLAVLVALVGFAWSGRHRAPTVVDRIRRYS